MGSPLQKGKKQRLRISQYYADGGTFLVRLLLGLGIYFILRLLISLLFMRTAGLSYEFSQLPIQPALLIVTALLLIAYLLLKGSRLQFAASLWMPAIALFLIPLALDFFKALFQAHYEEALLGILPQLFFFLLFVLTWIMNPSTKKLRITLSLLLAIFSIFWISDIPKSLKLSRDLQEVMGEYQSFHEKLREQHAIPENSAPLFMEVGSIQSSAEYLQVLPQDYRIDSLYVDIKELYYVSEICIRLAGPEKSRIQALQDLQFNEIGKAKSYYFYKYSLHSILRLGDFRYYGDVFYRAVKESGEAYYLDQLLVRKMEGSL